MSRLTIFTTPKPFTDPHITMIQRNALRSWAELGPDVTVVLVGDEEGMANASREYHAIHLPQVTKNSSGTPLLSSIFSLGRSVNDSPLLAYVNADIILLPDFLETAAAIQERLEKFLIVGQRWDLDVREPLDISSNFPIDFKRQVLDKGRLHPRGGSDYFIFPRACFQSLPDFAIGRAGWDNWMIYHGRRMGWPVIDTTESIMIVHQQHDYRHLPGGQVHYRQPESFENIRLAGGSKAIFTLHDTNFRFDGIRLKKYAWNWKKFWREVEIFPLVSLKSKMLAALFFALFHPKKIYQGLRNWLAQGNIK